MTTARLDETSRVRPALAGRWRVLVTPAASGAANMGMDQALMERARQSAERCLRVYSWDTPTLSFGRHQAVRGRLDAGQARSLGVSLVRRPTGGRALLHHREVTYSVTARLGRDDSARDWYGAITGVLLAALRALGVKAEVAHAGARTPLPATASCFVQPDEGEITVGGRKLVGSALFRQDGALLQHGSILLDDDQQLLNELLPAGELRPAPAGTLREALGTAPSAEAVADALRTALARSGPAEVSTLDPDPWLRDQAAVAERLYASEDWTFRH